MFTSFLKDKSGNMAIMSAFVVFAIAIAVGAALDISTTAKKKQNLQDMLDSAVLAAVQSDSKKRADLKKIIDSTVAVYNTENWPINVSISLKNDILSATATTRHKTSMMKMVGHKRTKVVANSAAPLVSAANVNIALVLDTTASMNGANIDSLKKAAKAMVKTLGKNQGEAKVSVVPFGRYVNVNKNNKNKNWIDVSKDGTSTTREHCYDERRTIEPRVCTGTGRYQTRDVYEDGTYQRTDRWEIKDCTGGTSEPTGNRICKDITTTYTWHGCAGSREAPYNLKAPYASQKIPGILNVTCGTKMLPLTKRLDRVESRINELTTSGETYLPSGLIWGWRTLQKDTPFANVTKPKDVPINALVLMTDGHNTVSQSSNGEHNGTNAAAANTRTKLLCEAVKNDDIQVFTVGYKISSAPQELKDLLQNCASEKGHFIRAENSQQLTKAFQDIIGKLRVIRLVT